MSGLALLIPVALLLGLSGLAAFFWAIRSGQFDDLDGAALRILIDEDEQKSGADHQEPPRSPRTGKLSRWNGIAPDRAEVP